MVFPDSNLSMEGAVGFALSFGGVWSYAWLKLRRTQKVEAQQTSSPKKPNNTTDASSPTGQQPPQQQQ